MPFLRNWEESLVIKLLNSTMSPLKKGELLGKETARLIPMNRDGQVETVEEVILFKISPPWQVNKKLPVIITVFHQRWISEFLVLCKIQFKFQPFLSKLIIVFSKVEYYNQLCCIIKLEF